MERLDGRAPDLDTARRKIPESQKPGRTESRPSQQHCGWQSAQTYWRPVDVQDQGAHAQKFWESLNTNSAAHEAPLAQGADQRVLVPFFGTQTRPDAGRSPPNREVNNVPKATSKAKTPVQPTKQRCGQAKERPKQGNGKLYTSLETQRPTTDLNSRTMQRKPSSPLPPLSPTLLLTTPMQKNNQGRMAPVRVLPCKPGPAALAVRALQQQVLSNWAGPAFSLPPAPERLPMPSKALLGDKGAKGATCPTP